MPRYITIDNSGKQLLVEDKLPVVVITATAYAIQITDRVIVFGGTANATFTLPARLAGRHFYVKNKTNRVLTINGSGSNIDGSATLSLNKQYASVLLIADSTEWGIY